jgi:hypothetical protein
MKTFPLTKFLCGLCDTPVNLTTDRNADQKGKPIHQKCDMDLLTGKKSGFIRLWAMSLIYRPSARSDSPKGTTQ